MWRMSHQGTIVVQRFVDTYAPDGDVQVPSAAFLEYAAQHAPAELVELWSTHGLGFYGQQRLALVDPSAWTPVLQRWLGSDVRSIPFAVTSFGHVYHVEGDGPVQCLDPHFVSNTYVAPDVVGFFNDHLTTSGSHLADLEGPRGGARSKFGDLEAGEIYCFNPPLSLGGTVGPDSLDKADGVAKLVEIHEGTAAQRG